MPNQLLIRHSSCFYSIKTFHIPNINLYGWVQPTRSQRMLFFYFTPPPVEGNIIKKNYKSIFGKQYPNIPPKIKDLLIMSNSKF